MNKKDKNKTILTIISTSAARKPNLKLPALAMRKRGDIQSAQDKRKVIALAVELDDQGKGLVDWKQVGVTEQ